MMRSDLTADQQARMKALFDALGLKSQLRRVAAKMLRETPEYAQARAEGRARDWLYQEAASAAELLYESVLARMENLDEV